MPRRILIVDNSATLFKAISSDLEEEGYIVEIALTPEEATKKCKRKSFNLIIMDITLPGISGLELLSKIKKIKENEDFASIMITGYGSLETAVEAMRGGANDYFTKPLNLEELKGSIRRVFAE